MESIRLDGLDGFEFEELCKRIFEKLNLAKVTYLGHTGDEGRDLILEGYKGGRAIVECKHWPGSSIGRPIVQKLHSATISSNARQALVVTTGHFSKEAVEYAKKLISNGIQMELIDLPILSDMARRAGIRLLAKGQSYPIETLHVSKPSELSNKVSAEVLSLLMSSPGDARGLTSAEPGILEFRSSYLVTYNIHQNFVTSVGRIHSVHADKQRLLVNGVNGQMIDPDLAAFIFSSWGSEGVHPGYDNLKVVREEFKLDLHSLQEAAKTHIINLNTQRIRYSGRNNRRYSKVCKPSEKSVYLASVTQVYYPYWHLSIRALKHTYKLEALENRDHVQVTSTDMFTCKECGNSVPNHEVTLLCNGCGAVVHRKKSHGFVCENCNKTVCRSCTFWTRKWLILKRKLCETCADESVKLGKPKQKIAAFRD